MKAAFLAAAALGGAAALLATVPAAAQSDRIARVVVYGNDPCPTSASGDEVVVCARRPERERYRIPKELRDRRNGGENPSWAERAESLEYVGRSGAQSCSTVGPGGFTGCWNQMVRAYRKDRQQGHTGEEPAPDK
ncbi:MAG: hypothetical protein QOE79_726 [Sphingomonadales bacterium]|jgi:hypothetical protein|nr:hypothetical protein [Sphingomonadales bacterium]MEA3048725.1 hypothetical protein [Sphingomonadales bacterium]